MERDLDVKRKVTTGNRDEKENGGTGTGCKDWKGNLACRGGKERKEDWIRRKLESMKGPRGM